MKKNIAIKRALSTMLVGLLTLTYILPTMAVDATAGDSGIHGNGGQQIEESDQTGEANAAEANAGEANAEANAGEANAGEANAGEANAGEASEGEKASTDIPLAPLAQDEAGYYILSSESDVARVAEHPGEKYKLEADIALASDPLKDIEFSGELDGNGYRISNIQERMFGATRGATIKNIIIDGKLAEQTFDTVIIDSGFCVSGEDSNQDYALIGESEATTIEGSFVLADIKGRHVAGFVLNGNANIVNSYVSGSLQGETVYGFGEQVTVTGSYLSASLSGKERALFTKGSVEHSFYDAQINDLEEGRATAYFTDEITSGTLGLEGFKEEKGAYPGIKTRDNFKPNSQKVISFSTLKIDGESNLSAFKGSVELSTEVNDEKVKWSGDAVSLQNNKASLNGTSGELVAQYDGMNKRYALKSVKTISGATAGSQTTEQTTSVTYPVAIGKYYKVVETGTTVEAPTTHEAAVLAGWKVMYWDGTYTQTGLKWNQGYDIHSTDFKQVTKQESVTTKYGKVGGTIALTGNYAFGEIVTATLNGTNTTKGTMYFESAPTLDATSWTAVSTVPLDEGTASATYTVKNSEANKYLRARFVSDDATGYQGTLKASTDTLVKEAITTVSITNKSDTENKGTYTLEDKLVASVEPVGKDNDVIFNWYQEGQEPVLATGRNYTLKASDVGKQIYVKATAKAAGELKGEKQSAATSVVASIKNTKPAIAGLKLLKKDDITATVKMEATSGLYRYGIADAEGGAKREFPVLARANTSTIITGLEADHTYYIYVQHVGEEGYLDSEWSDQALSVTTNHPHVKGDVEVTGNAVYNQTLTATLVNGMPGQTGKFIWYRLNENDERIKPALATTMETEYKLVKEDIGKKIEVVYEGTGDYAGEIAVVTDTIAKKEKEIPDANLTVAQGDSGDTWIEVTMPTNGDSEAYIIGLSQTRAGVPVEVLDGEAVKELASGVTYKIEQLQRDTDYYLFVRYASNDTHEKSAWVAADTAVHVRTTKTAFAGNVSFEYATNPAKLMAGQTLTARLTPNDSSFNYKGEWKWYKTTNETDYIEVTDYTFTDDKRGTSYVIPEGTDVGTKYKVTFQATVGYEGKEEKTSVAVEQTVKAQYNTPNASHISMEAVDDSTIKVKMTEGDGLYRFWYKKAETSIVNSIASFVKSLVASNDGYTDSEKTVSSHTDVLLEKLDRNTEYIVKVQRVEDNEGSASEFAYSKNVSLSATTHKTEIAGNVTISGTEQFGETLTATYNPASYASTGDTDDTTGTWQWYRGDQPISGVASKVYEVKAEDVGQILKAEYKMEAGDNFQGKTSVVTRTIEKAISANPEVTNVTSKFNATSKQMNITITGSTSNGSAKVYYRVQKNGEQQPDFPDDTQLSGWTESTSATTTMTLDSDNRELLPQSDCVVYIIRTATPTTEGSAVLSKEFKVGAKNQTGTIAYTGRTHVGKELTATLNDGNNEVGEWHWYYSITDYTNTSPSSWTELKSGFSPKDNSPTSTLLVPDEAKGRYIKAKFLSTDEKYNGTVEGVTTATVTKTFTEKLSISGKGYAGETLTVKLEGSDRDLTQTETSSARPSQKFNVRVVQLQYANGTGIIDNKAVTVLGKDSFQVTVPSTYSSSYDECYFSVLVNSPDIKIYTKEDGSPIGDNFVRLDKADRLQFHYGVPISSATDFRNFMQGTANYTNRSGHYILTNNVDMSSVSSATPVKFSGVLNGDFHTILNLKNIVSSDNSNSTIKNLFISGGSLYNHAQDTGVFSSSNSTNYTISQVFIVNFNLEGMYNTALFGGKYNGRVLIERSGSAGGTITTRDALILQNGQPGATLSGILGWGYQGNGTGQTIKDVSNINTGIVNSRADGQTELDGCGAIWGGSATGAEAMNIQNSYVVSPMALPYSSGSPNKNSGILFGISRSKDTMSNVYYDKNVIKSFGTYKGDPFNLNQTSYGRGTEEMTGTSLQSAFGDDVWQYKEGFYPRLRWILEEANENSQDTVHWYNIFTASRRAFVSIDGNTSLTDLSNGVINGTLQIPSEFLQDGFAIDILDEYGNASSRLSKTVSNTLVPVQKGKVQVKITYKGVSNTFAFTVNTALGVLQDVSIAKQAMIGSNIKAVNSNSGVSYKWYRRKASSDNKEAIIGQAKDSYTPVTTDAGYQIQVEISKSGYGTIVSNWSDPVQVGAPTSAPTISDITDNSAKITGNAGLGNYEFAYATTQTGEKIILDTKGASASIDRLARNTTYYVWARNAGGAGYVASGWSPVASFKTAQTDLVGQVTFGSGINNGQQLSLSAPTTNDQEGVWTLERRSADGNTSMGSIAFDKTSNVSGYTLTSADVGYKIKATFTGTGDYKGAISNTSEIVKKSNVSAPSAPTFKSSDDKSITLHINGTGKYDVGYATEANGVILTSLSNQDGDSDVTLPNLSRNKTYYVYTKVLSTDSQEESPWSQAVQMSTIKSAVSGEISITGDQKTDSAITFTAPPTNNQTGLWKLERVEGSSTTTISPSAYSVDSTGRGLSYTLTPKDAKAVMKATFSGTGDFNSSIEISTGTIQEDKQTEDGFPSSTDIEISNLKDYSFDIKTKAGEDNYQFGYTSKGGLVDTVKTVDATAGKNVPININGLTRNTEYDIYMRKASKLGYVAGQWNKMITVKTDKSALTGSINYLIVNPDTSTKPAIPGVADVNVTYKARYEPGKYSQAGDDSQAGTWQWYANGAAIENATTDTYTIAPMLGTVEITVQYNALETSAFKDVRSASIGALTKPAFDAPSELPQVAALPEDGNAGSRLEITATDVADTYFYVQKSSNPAIPATTTAVDANNNDKQADQWFKADTTNTLVLEADTGYVVYAAKLENGSNVSSGVVSQRAVSTVKENLGAMPTIEITAADDTPWKVGQAKELRISNHGQVVRGSWQYYVSKDTTIDTSWQNVTSEIKNELVEGDGTDHTYTKVTFPVKYSNDYYVKVVFTGRGSYQGTKTYVSPAKLVGTAIQGQVELTNSDQVSEIFVPINVKYVYAKDAQGNPIVDEDNGVWTWYREKTAGGNEFERIQREADAIGLEDKYRPTAADVGKKIYAVYSGAPKSTYSGSVQSKIFENVERSSQTKPEAITIKQVNGTTVQVNLPSNYKADGKTVPQAVVEYRKQGDTTWTKNPVADSWIGRGDDKLKAKTTYELRTQYQANSEYKESEYSEIDTVTTGNQSFNEDSLSVTEPTTLESGSTIKATFSGPGYDDGYFVVNDTLDQALVAQGVGTISGTSITMEYVITDASIGQNIIVQYVAKADATTYGGFLEKSTGEVLKPAPSTNPETPVLETVSLHEDQLKVKVDSTLEYVLDESSSPQAATSAKWQKLTPDAEGYYVFTGLAKNTAYYLHARAAETANFRHGVESKSALTKTWTRSTYQIKYLGVEGATNGDPANPTMYTELDSDIVLRAPTKVGYTFTGWTWDQLTTPSMSVTIDSGSAGNKIYTANWKINQYKVTFDGNGGTPTEATREKNYQESLGALPEATRTGYRFDGWYDAKTDGTLITAETKMPENGATYYAHWTAEKYIATFNGNGGTPDEATREVDYDTALGELPKATRTGYEFAGWYDAATDGTKITAETKMPLNGAIYYARWTIKSYTATFDGNGGTPESQTRTENYQVPFGTLPVVEKRDGYEFEGWYTAKTGGTKVEPITTMPADNVIYYARWVLKEYIISYDLNDEGTGTAVNGANPTTYTIESGDIVLMAPKWAGHAFTGWIWEGQAEAQKVVTIPSGSHGNKKYTANWELSDYVVKFDSQKGSLVDDIEAKHGVEITKPADPDRTGYAFQGWYKEQACINEWKFADGVMSNMTLYAKWEADIYTIKYHLNDGDAGAVNGANPTTYTIESDNIVLVAPKWTGHTFLGWTWDTEDSPQPAVKIRTGSVGNKEYTAHWKISTYDVVFDTQGGTTIPKQAIDHGGKASKPSDPTKAGYVFAGWYKDEARTIPWNFATDVVEANTTIYARFQFILSTVESNQKDGSYIEKGTEITFTQKEGADIYYTIDGSTPNRDSIKYTTPIKLAKTATIRAIAIKEDCVDSNISEYTYFVQGDIKVEIDNDAPIKIEMPESELMEAVLTEEEYQAYRKGRDIRVRISCEEIENGRNETIDHVLGDRIIGKYYDVSIYKQIGTGAETLVPKLNKQIRITFTIPDELLPQEGITRIFDMIRIHNGKAELLNDIDKNEKTITIESDEFSTYILCYRDKKAEKPAEPAKPATPEEKPTKPEEKPTQPNEGANTGDMASHEGWYAALLISLGLGALIISKKKKQKKKSN